MKRERSWTRIDYNRAYRMMRSGVRWDLRGALEAIPNEINRAAFYSYEAYGYEQTGWISDRRRQRFYAIKICFLTRQELPF